MESKRHQRGESPVRAYQTLAPAFSWPTEYMNKKKSMETAITVWSILDSNRFPMVSGTVVAPSLTENSLVFIAASQMQGMIPTRLHIPANHIPEKPRVYTIPVLPQKAQPEM